MNKVSRPRSSKCSCARLRTARARFSASTRSSGVREETRQARGLAGEDVAEHGGRDAFQVQRAYLQIAEVEKVVARGEVDQLPGPHLRRTLDRLAPLGRSRRTSHHPLQGHITLFGGNAPSIECLVRCRA